MLKDIKNYFLKRAVKFQVELYYLQFGITPKDIETMTMQEILDKIEYTMKNLAGWRTEYYKTLDTVATLNGEIVHLNATFKDLEKQIDGFKSENIKLTMKNQFLTQQCKTHQLVSGRLALDKLKEKNNVVSYGSERERG